MLAELPVDVPRRVQRLRARRGLTQANLAALLGVSAKSVRRWEQGAVTPHRSVWARLVALEVDAAVEVDSGAPTAMQPILTARAGPGRRKSAAGVSPLPPFTRDGGVPASVAGGLAASVGELIGRERELAKVAALLARSRLLTLTGPGGCGKTRLALALARRQAQAFADGVRVVELAGLTEPGSLVQTVAAALAVHEQPGRPLADALAGAIAGKRLLLVLDNCEHLLDACAPLVAQLLQAAGALTVLATSREPLAIAAEAVWQVPPLTQPERARGTEDGHADLAAIERAESVQLFVARARARVADFTLTPENAGAVAELCVRLDGLPLAIEMAAARVTVLTPREIAARLDDRFRLLTGTRRAVVPRHQTLQAALDWSYALLTPDEQQLFARLGVFAGRFTLAAAEAVAGDPTPLPGAGSRWGAAHQPAYLPTASVLDLLGRLVEQSLVAAETMDGATRYRLLDTLRAYAREQLLASGEAEAAFAGHSEYYLGLARELAVQASGADQAGGLGRFEAEYDDLRAALVWLIERDDGGRALRLAISLQRYWGVRGYLSEGRRWFARALACRRQERSIVRAEALRHAGSLARQQSDYAAAEPLLSESVALHEELENRRGMAHSLVELAATRLEAGDFAEAEALGLRGLDMMRELGDAAGLLQTLTLLGLYAVERRHFGIAQERYEEAFVLASRLGRRDAAATLQLNLGVIACERGDYQLATAQFERTLLLAEEVGDRRTAAYAYGNLARTCFLCGDLAAGEQYSVAALRLSVELDFAFGIASVLEMLGCIAVGRNAGARAARLFGKVDIVRQERQLPANPYWREARREAEAIALRTVGEAAYAATYAAGVTEPLAPLLTELLAQGRDGSLAGPSVLPAGQVGALRRGAASGLELTEREREVLALVAQGRSTKEIARALVLSPRTVERHLANLYPKIGARGRADAIAYALGRVN